MNKIRFGPAGNSDSFYESGHKSTVEAPEWVAALGLDAFEYSFGRGVRIKEQLAEQIAAAAARCDIAMSVHAPYYINLVTDDPEKQAKNAEYILGSMRAGKWMGATRVVVHPGAAGKVEPQAAFELVWQNLSEILGLAKAEGIDDVIVCPETMGKLGQYGTVDEVVRLCKLDERMVPTVDFGHVNARSQGGLKTQADYAAVLDVIENTLGRDRLNILHCHFSRIEFTKSGEKRHWTYDDVQYGPNFEPLADELVKRSMTPTIICESKGTMADDAVRFKAIYTEKLDAAK